MGCLSETCKQKLRARNDPQNKQKTAGAWWGIITQFINVVGEGESMMRRK